MSSLKQNPTRVALCVVSVTFALFAAPKHASAQFFESLGANGTLSVHGTNGEDEIVAFFESRRLGRVYSRSKCLVVEVRHRLSGRLLGEAVYLKNRVSALHINALAEDDLVDCSAMNIPCYIYGGGGSDDLIGGKNDDDIDGGDGSDDIEGGPGDDILFGGAEPFLHQDADNIHGNGGEDTLIGSVIANYNAMYDVLMGGANEDTYIFCNFDWIDDDDEDPIWGLGGSLAFDYWSTSNPWGVNLSVIEQRY